MTDIIMTERGYYKANYFVIKKYMKNSI